MADRVVSRNAKVGAALVVVMLHESGTATISTNVRGEGASASAGGSTRHATELRDLEAAIGEIARLMEARTP